MSAPVTLSDVGLAIVAFDTERDKIKAEIKILQRRLEQLNTLVAVVSKIAVALTNKEAV